MDDEHYHPHNVGSQQEYHHDHEKKSVLKKVKAKAKKIKDTITKHGHHDHDHEHGHGYHYEDQHIPDDHDLDEEDDEDIQDPEIHGAPIYESGTARIPGKVNPGVNFGGTRVMGEAPHHEPKVVVVSPTTTHNTNQSRTLFHDPATTFVGEDKRNVNLQRPMGLEEDPHAPRTSTLHNASAPANYQTKVADPTGTGGAEIDISPVQKSFASMTVHNEPEPKILPTVTNSQLPSSTIGHNQFVPQLSTATKTHYPSSTQTHGQHLPELSGEVKTQYPKIQDQNFSNLSSATNVQYPSAGSHDQFNPQFSTEPSLRHYGHNFPQQSSATKTPYPSLGTHDQNIPYMSKNQYPLSGRNDEFVQGSLTQPQIQNMPKTQYPSAGSHDQFGSEFSTQPKTGQTYTNEELETSSNQSSYMDKISTVTTAIADKATTAIADNAVAAKNAVASTLGYGEKDTATTQGNKRTTANPSNQGSYTEKLSLASTAIADKAATAKNAVASKLGYGGNDTTTTQANATANENPSNQSSYTDKLSSATTAVADKAAATKNAVASKLGYGENDTTATSTTTTSNKNPSNQSSYTEKLSSATSAIADKAVSAKNTVASKLGLGETQEQNKTENPSTISGSPTNYGKNVASSLTEKLAPAGTGNRMERGNAVEQDKGVSVKDYFVEKLRPGEEDRALSEVISETVHKKEEKGVNEGRLGKVTESEEVKRRLGSDEKTEKFYEERYVNSPGEGVVDKVKNVVLGSWFGTQEENPSSQEGEYVSRNSDAEVEKVNQATRRLHESSN